MKEEEITEAGAVRSYMDMLAEDFLCSPPSYFSPAAALTPTCSSYLSPHQLLSFNGQQDDDAFAFQYGSHVPVAPQKSSPTYTEQCSSSVSSMSSSPTATISSSRAQAKKKGRGGDQKKAASAATAASKRPRITAPASSSGNIKVRKERLGERILALQQLVSPFGKSDTASVLHEALGYIRFLHDQVQVLSSPYLQRQLPPSSALVQESSGGVVAQRPSDLRSRGLCLVPISCTEHVAGSGSNGADLWSAAAAEKNTHPAPAASFQQLRRH